ncbi:MAG TPA: cellulase family glycosylhydrolase, partial [Acidimicrobiia bacterium]|nr:cellulase family glycosylhydrolase [Acidimicrobiia bacterium]
MAVGWFRGLAVAAVIVVATACQAAPPAPTQPSPAPTSGFLTRSGTQLVVHGQPYGPVGLDVYELATDWGTNAGCGGMFDDAGLASFFSGLPAGSTVRMWAFQGSMATDPATGTINWAPLDRVVAAAEAHGIYLIVSLANQSGDCDDGHWKDLAWYQGGYRNAYPGSGNADATLSYWNWVQEIVTRYRSSTAIGMWELVNEPEASACAPGYTESACFAHLSCPSEATAATALRSFYDTVGAEVHTLDPNHLVESGADGGAQCGWADGSAANIDASPQID